jgi:hypothetical protein
VAVHPEPKRAEERAAAEPQWAQQLRSLGRAAAAEPEARPQSTPDPAPEPESSPAPTPQAAAARAEEEEDVWVDRIALAREFAAILTPEDQDEEGK